MFLVSLFWFALLSIPAIAQEGEPPAAPPPAETVGETVDADAEAAALYRMGLDLVGRGKYTEACGVFARVSERYGATSYAAKAEEQMALAAVGEGGGACGEAPPSAAVAAEPAADSSPKSRDALARSYDGNGFVELLISQGLMGPALFGVGLPLAMGTAEPAVYLGMGLIGLGAGITTPILINKRWKIGEGQAMSVFSGEYMGGLNGAMLATLLESPTVQGVGGLVSGGVVLGGAAATTYAVLARPHAGDVSMFRSGFSWGAYLGATSFLFVDPSSKFFARVILFADVGAAIGAGLSAAFDISRVRMNVINLSGFAGAAGLALLTGFVELATPGSALPKEVWGSVLIAGAAGGVAVGVVGTKRMDDHRKLAFLGASGAMVGYDDGKWGIGAPTPMPRINHDGTMGWQVGLAQGRF